MIMKPPVIFINFKAYKSATGENALKMARKFEKIARKFRISVVLCVQNVDLYRVSQAVAIPVFAQHADNIEYGAHTGYVLPEALKQNGAYGTLLNHAEHQISDESLKSSIERAKQAGLFTLVCANTPGKAGKILKYNPDFVAVEPPELIGGDISVSKAKPEVIKKAVKIAGQKKLIVGAGIKTGEDVKIAVKFGAAGVLVASGVVQAQNPQKALIDLAKGLL
ncbi:triose-phosphate isomerase [Candidatus Peregrinibacteria bacterium]|nr:triose-phosphate isomerase [Candidatus Peregrinibacteria bacterium]